MQILYSKNKKAFRSGGMKLVEKMDKKINLSETFKPFKTKGVDLDKLIKAILSVWTQDTEIKSIRKITKEIKENPVLLKELGLKKENIYPKMIYRALEIVGKQPQKIYDQIIDKVKKEFKIDLKKVFLDWTSSYFHGKNCPLAKKGHSSDKRPDKPQIKIGLAMSAKESIVFHHSVLEGNTQDSPHFEEDYEVCKNKIPEGALMIFDKGSNSKEHREWICSDDGNKHHYLTAPRMSGWVKETSAKMNEKDMKKIKTDNNGDSVYSCTREHKGETYYFYYSEKRARREKQKDEKKLKNAMEEKKELGELAKKKGWKAVKEKLTKKKTKTKKLGEVIVKKEVTIQRRLVEKTEKQLKEEIIGDKKNLYGMFALVASKDMDPKKALDRL